MTLARRISLVTSLTIVVTTALFATLAAFSSRNAALDAVDQRITELRRTVVESGDPVSALLQSVESTSPDFVATLIVVGEDPISLLESTPTAPTIAPLTIDQLSSALGDAITIGSGIPFRVVSIGLGNEQWLVFGERVEAIQSQLERQLLTNALIALLLTILGGTLSAIITRKSLRPIGQIVDFSQRVALGHLDISLVVDSTSLEVRELQESISSMVDSLKDAANSRAQSESSMREFLADVAHELRTPLTTVRAYGDLLATTNNADPETRARAQDRIAQESRRMSRLIDDLLLLARLSSTKPEQSERFDVCTVVKSHADDLAMLDPERPIDIGCTSHVICANRALIERLFANVFSNIHRHTPATAPIEIRCTTRDEFVEFTIDDSGPGLEQAHIQQLALGTQRFGSVRSTDQHGTGLGLHLLTSIARSHGGEVLFAKGRLGGLCVTIRLPETALATA